MSTIHYTIKETPQHTFKAYDAHGNCIADAETLPDLLDDLQLYLHFLSK